MIKILENSIFSTKSTRNSIQRRKDLKEKFATPPDDYFYFGRSYFDGGDSLPGYGQYIYDGRYAETISNVISSIGLKKTDYICEVGCAKGFILHEFFLNGFKKIIGFDISEYAINSSPESIRNILKVAPANFLSVEDLSIDFLFSKEMMPHLDNDQLHGFYSEINRSVKVSGKVYFEIQYPESNKEAVEIIEWDPTHKLLFSRDNWLLSFEQLRDDINIFVYFKRLFENDCD
jgi:SAM-dependent methyltransferase